MRSLKRVPVYREDGKTNITHLQNKVGVYVIYENAKIVYIGHSRSNLYKTILRHFQEWPDRQQRRVTYVDYLLQRKYTVKVWLTQPADAPILEEGLIEKIKPRDNELKLLHIYSKRQQERVGKRLAAARPVRQDQISDGPNKRQYYNTEGENINPITGKPFPDDPPF